MFYLFPVWAAIASVGWYIFFVVIGLFFASPYLSEKYQSWKQKKDEKEYAAKYHKSKKIIIVKIKTIQMKIFNINFSIDPDLAEERLRGIEAARQRMQDEYRQAAEIARQKEEERKEAKRQELEKLANNLDGGQKLGTSSSTKLKSSFKDGTVGFYFFIR